METIIVIVVIIVSIHYSYDWVFPCSRPYVKNKHFTYALSHWFLIKFGTTTRSIPKKVSSLFVIVHLAHGGSWRVTSHPLQMQGSQHNCKPLRSTCHGPGAGKCSVFLTTLWSRYHYILPSYIWKVRSG